MSASLEEALKADPPCFPRACAIQNCIQKNNYDESKCQQQIDRLYECCKAFYEREGDDAKSVCCPKPALLRRKMEQRAAGKS